MSMVMSSSQWNVNRMACTISNSLLLSTIWVQMTTGKKIKFYAQGHLCRDWQLLFPGGSVVKNSPASAGDAGDMGSIPGLEKSPGVEWLPTTVCLLGKFHGQRSPVGYSPWGLKQSDTEHACMSLCSQPIKYYKMFSGTLCLQDSDSFYETESSMVTCFWEILSHTIYNWIICGRTSQSLNLLYQWALCRGQHRAFRIFQSHLSQATSVPADICRLHWTILSLISDSCRGSLWVWWEKNMTSLFSSLTTNNKLPLS